MNKADLVDAIAAKAKCSKREAESALDAFTDTVSTSLKKGDAVRIGGFGTFQVRHRKARKGRVPGTGKPINIPAKRVPFFKAYIKLK